MDYNNSIEEPVNYYYGQSCDIDTNLGHFLTFDFLKPRYCDLTKITSMTIKGTYKYISLSNIPVQLARCLDKFTNLSVLKLVSCYFNSYELLLFFPKLEILSLDADNLPLLNKTNPNLKILELPREYLGGLPISLEELTISVNNEINPSIKNLVNLKKISIIYKSPFTRFDLTIIECPIQDEFTNLVNLEEIIFRERIPINISEIVNSNPNIKKLKFKNLDQSNKNSPLLKHISNITHLHLGNYIILNGKDTALLPELPECLEVLELFDFNLNLSIKNIKINNLPINLKELTINYNGVLLLDNLPPSLEKLKLNYDFRFNNSDKNIKSMIKLPFGCELYINDLLTEI